MALAINHADFKSYFNAGDKPSEGQFAALIDALALVDASTGTVVYKDGSTYVTGQIVKTATLSITTAEVLHLFTTPKPFGIDVPSGYAVQPLSWHMRSTFNSVAYATNTNLLLRCITGGPVNNLGSMNSVLAFTNNTFTANGLSIGGVANSDCLTDGADLEVLVETGNPTAGDSDITIYLTYILIEI